MFDDNVSLEKLPENVVKICRSLGLEDEDFQSKAIVDIVAKWETYDPSKSKRSTWIYNMCIIS